MAYNYSKGTQVVGDLKAADDAQRDTKIDFEEDYIALHTSGSAILIVSGSKVAIGPTPHGVSSFPSHKLDVNGDIRIRNNNIRDNSGNKVISFDGTGHVKMMQVAGSETDSSALENGSISFYLDEDDNELKVKVKYSDGLIKSGSISLS